MGLATVVKRTTMPGGSGRGGFAVLLAALLEELHQEEHERQHQRHLEQDGEEGQEQERGELEQHYAHDSDGGELQDWLQHLGLELGTEEHYEGSGARCQSSGNCFR